MDNLRRWFAYDWFKLLIALVLLAIFVILLLRPGSPAAAPAPPQAAAPETAAGPTLAPPTATLAQPSATSQPTATATAQPSATALPTATPLPSPTAAPSPTPEAAGGQASAAEATATPEPEPAAEAAPAANGETGDCAQAIATRLEIGAEAVVRSNLHLRQAAGMEQPVLLTNLPGQTVVILDGPVCLPYGSGVYRWWNIQNSGGQNSSSVKGWSAEGSLRGESYFLDPQP